MSKTTRFIRVMSLWLLPQAILLADHLGLAGRSYRAIDSSGGSSLINHVAMAIQFDESGTVELMNSGKYIFWSGTPLAFCNGSLIESGTQGGNIAIIDSWSGMPPSNDFITCSDSAGAFAEEIGDANSNYRVSGAMISTNHWDPYYLITVWNTSGGGTAPYNVFYNNCYSFVRFVESRL